MPPQKLPNEEILTDLVARFIFNVPDFERNTFERLMFLVEQAHWHYEDCIVDRNSELKSLSIKEFTALIFEKTPGLEEYKEMCSDILRDWQAYKSIVPVYGAILLDPSLTHCLMVRGYKANAGWGFPRGKVAKDEEGPACAIREVKEETGFDITNLIKPSDYIEVMSNNQTCRLYVIAGVDRATCFAPQVKKEIGGFAWHSIEELPVDKDEASQVFLTENGERHRFFMVWPFVKQLRKWIARQRRQGASTRTAAPPAAAASVGGLQQPPTRINAQGGATQQSQAIPVSSPHPHISPAGAVPPTGKGMKHSKSAGRIKGSDKRREQTAATPAAGVGEGRGAGKPSNAAVGKGAMASAFPATSNTAVTIDQVLPGYSPFVAATPRAWTHFKFDAAKMQALMVATQ